MQPDAGAMRPVFIVFFAVLAAAAAGMGLYFCEAKTGAGTHHREDAHTLADMTMELQDGGVRVTG